MRGGGWGKTRLVLFINTPPGPVVVTQAVPLGYVSSYTARFTPGEAAFMYAVTHSSQEVWIFTVLLLKRCNVPGTAA